MGNAEITVTSASPFKQQKRKVSVGEFFRLKSSSSSSFSLQGKEHKRNWDLWTLMETETDELNTSLILQNKESSTFKAPIDSERVKMSKSDSRKSYLSDDRNSSVYAETTSSTKDSLSLSCIAKILSNVDTCASPRTLVANILKQNGLCKSSEVKDETVSYLELSSSVSCTNTSSDRILKDSSNIEQLAANQSKLLSYSNVPLIPLYSKDNDASYNSTEVQSTNGDSLTGISTRKDIKTQYRAMEEINSLRKNNDSKSLKTLTKKNKDLFDVNPRFHSDINPEIKDSNLCGIESSIASGNLSVLKFDEKIQVEGCMWNLIQELSDMPRESVDCSALIPTLQEKYPWLLSQTGDEGNSRQENTSSLDMIKMKYSTSVLSEFSESSVSEQGDTAAHQGEVSSEQ